MTVPSESGGASGDRLSTGIDGVDAVLDGGILPGRSILVRGPPGAGKTLFGLHYLTEGGAPDEKGLFINFGEPEEYLRRDATSFGFDLDAVEFVDFAPSGEDFTDEATYDVFDAAEVEGQSLAAEITNAVEDVQPDRVVIDPATQLRYMAPNDHQFRNQMIALLRLIREQGATTIFTSQQSSAAPDDDLQFLSDGVLHLGSGDDRTLRVTKFRGSDFQSGEHTVRITDDRMQCAPRLVPERHERAFSMETIPSGVPELDELVHGGLDRGTVTFLSGPTGVGKTTTGIQFLKEAAGRGEPTVLYTFEEQPETILHRAKSINIPIQAMIDRGTLTIEEVEANDRTANEFGQMIREDVENGEATVVMIDGFDGFRRSLRGMSDDGVEEIMTIGRYLKNMGVIAIVTNEVHNITGEFQVTEVGTSYVADTIIFLRHIEHRGELRKVIGVLKKRTSDFERRLRELEITQHGIKVGEPLTDLQGILTGTPTWAPQSEEER